MLCQAICPRGIDCNPVSNIIADNGESFVCAGYHEDEKKDYPQDKFRHCFKSAAGTDSMFDHDEYDLKSIIAVLSETILYEELIKINEKED